MPEIVELIKDKRAREDGAELLRLIKAMADRHGRDVALESVAWAVGTFCDEISPQHANYMAARLMGMDPAKMISQAKIAAARKGMLS